MRKVSLPILGLVALLLTACQTGSEREIPHYADITLVGAYHREPIEWTAERFAPHVSYTDPAGQEHWLFEAFLFTEGMDPKRGLNLAISPTGKSAGKESWQDQLDFWLGPDGSVAELEKAVEAAAGRMGNPPFKRGVILTMPDPIMFEEFSDKTSSTTYWGDGLDFSRVEDQIAAYRWYIDTARARFQALAPKHLELAGFYVLSEELYVAYGETESERLNHPYKRWEQILPEISDYLHLSGEGLYWIPYHLAPGYKYWKRLGIDQVFMQPNWYWDLHYGNHPFDKTLEAVREYGMGMELEFEYSAVANEMTGGTMGPDGAGRLVFTEADVPALQDRVRHYMQALKDAGLYGTAPIAVYSGSNAWTQLATSPLPQDQALYRELCEFILRNPLRQRQLTVADGAVLQDGKTLVAIGSDGTLQALRNLETGIDYAGGTGLWRLYYNTLDQKEIQITAKEQKPVVTSDAGRIHIDYCGLVSGTDTLDFTLNLTVTLEDGQVRFAAAVQNQEPHTIIRELHYPLVGHLNLPEGYKLLTTHTGGQIFDDPIHKISDVDVRPLYMTPAQKFRQYDLQYPRNAASNCFAFTGTDDGLYFGSHDPSLQQTWHGLRTYPDEGTIGHQTQDFKHLEAGFYRYPNALCGDRWSNEASVIVPYRGDWTETSRLYRAWADTWWHHAPVPQWVQDMTGWQRIIFKHQYGEYLRKYTDLPGRIFEVGQSVGCDAVLAFGWWDEGMDNGYPNYTVDASQGGDAAWKQAIAEYRAKGGHLILYFNGRLIDVESDFYRSGEGTKVSNHDNTGREFTEHYKFTGEGTTLGYYDSRTFVIADMSQRPWRDKLLQMADRAMDYGANSVFYDQLGVAEEFPNWDLSREFPVQDVFTGRYKADALREIRDHIKAHDPEFCLGTEWLSDCTSQFCDFVHIVEFTALPESFPEWFRYTFPEVIWSDRCVRDDNDVPRRVNNTLLKGLRNDIEVFRCRGLIDETPVYQAHLAQINAIRHRFPELLLEGRFAYKEDFSCHHPSIVAREYVNGDRMAVVATYLGSGRVSGRIEAKGWKPVDSAVIGRAKVRRNRIDLGCNDLAVLVFERD